MIERILIIAAIAIAVTVIWAGIRLWRARALHRLAVQAPFAGLVEPGRPAVVSFSTPGCAECRTRQAPALKRLAAELGEQVTLLALLAPEHPQLIDRLGILTVPATVVLDATGVVRFVNLGFADSAKLAAQLNAAANHPRHAPTQGAYA